MQPHTKFRANRSIFREVITFRIFFKMASVDLGPLYRKGPYQFYHKGPLSQKSAHAEQYALTKTNTNPSPDTNRYRRRCPDPNARIQKLIHYMAIAAICDSGPLR